MPLGVGVRVFLRRPAILRSPRAQPRRFSSLANVIENDDSLSSILAHDRYGFYVNGIHMRGSILVFRKFTLLWNVQKAVDIAPRNAAIVHMVKPRVGALAVSNNAYLPGASQVNEVFLRCAPCRPPHHWHGGAPARSQPVALRLLLPQGRLRRGHVHGALRLMGLPLCLLLSLDQLGAPSSPVSSPQAHAIALFNTLNQEGRHVAAALVSREPLSRDDACAYVNGVPARTEADERLATALAADVEAHRAGGALTIGTSLPPLLLDSSVGGGLVGDGGSGSSVSGRAQAQGRAGSRPQESRPPQLAPPMAAVPTTPAPAPRPPTPPRPAYGVLQTAVQPGQEGKAPAPPPPTAPSSPLGPEQQALAEERTRRQQRPETSEDLLDALAERGARRSGGAAGAANKRRG
jgi:uncharacterized protein